MKLARFPAALVLLCAALTAGATGTATAPASAAEGDYPTMTPTTPTTPTVVPTAPPVSLTGDTWISSQSPAANYVNDPRLQVSNDATLGSRAALLSVSMGTVPADLYVKSAYLTVQEETGYSCGTQVNIGRITQAWNPATVTWANAPAFFQVKPNPPKTASGIVAPNCGDYDGYPEVHDVTSIVRSWASGTAPVYGIRLAVWSGAAGRRYHSAEGTSTIRPRLSVTWGFKPGQPRAVTIGPGSPGEVVSETPTLRVTLPPAPDNGFGDTRMSARISVTTAAGTPVWTGTSAAAAAGSIVAVTVPPGLLENGTQYVASVQAVNQDQVSGPSYTGKFLVDVYTAVVPAPPCTGLCIPTAAATQVVTVPAGGRSELGFSMPELSGEGSHVGTASLSIATPATSSAGGLKIFPSDATEPALPTLPNSPAAQVRTLSVPTNAETSSLSFINTGSTAATISVTLQGATDAFTAEDRARYDAEMSPNLSDVELEAVAAATTAGTSLTTSVPMATPTSAVPSYPSMAQGSSACTRRAELEQAASATYQETVCVYNVPIADVRATAAGTTTEATEARTFLAALDQAATDAGGSVCRDRLGWGWTATSRWNGCAAEAYVAEARVGKSLVAKQSYAVMLHMSTHATRLSVEGNLRLIYGPRFGDAEGFNYRAIMGCTTNEVQPGTCDTSFVNSDVQFFEPNGRNGMVHRIAGMPHAVGARTPFSFRLAVQHDQLGPDAVDPIGVFAGIRCDNTFRYPGCVFPTWRPTFRISLSDPVHPQSARHIKDAQDSANFARVVTRESRPSVITSNRNKAKSMCRQQFGASKNWQGQCDEYPFASTRQGCYVSGGWCSVRIIPGSDNMSSGGKLGAFIVSQRVMDGDSYAVEVVP